jgi:hypothetical protein
MGLDHTSQNDHLELLRMVADMTEQVSEPMFVLPELLRWAADEIEELRTLAEADDHELETLTSLLLDRETRD